MPREDVGSAVHRTVRKDNAASVTPEPTLSMALSHFTEPGPKMKEKSRRERETICKLLSRKKKGVLE